jgi:hypothetical protein
MVLPVSPIEAKKPPSEAKNWLKLNSEVWILVLVVVLVLENPDRFAIRLTEQISSIGLFAVTESQCTEDEHDDEDEDDSKFRNLS